MKIYINILPNNIDLTRLESYIKSTKQYKMIYSNDGIYKIDNSSIYHVIIKKEASKIVNCKSGKFYCDMSEVYYDKTNYIPITHKLIDIMQYKYKVNSKIYFLIEYVNGEIYNIYFDAPDCDDNVINTINDIINLIK